MGVKPFSMQDVKILEVFIDLRSDLHITLSTSYGRRRCCWGDFRSSVPALPGYWRQAHQGLVEGAINLGYSGFWVLLIRRLTPAMPPPLPLRRPWVVLALGLLAFLLVQLLDFGVVQANPFRGWGWGSPVACTMPCTG